MTHNQKAFTLVEILVVVLIIGILTAIAVPMYQSAVDKTHWSTLLPTARALKNAEEAYLMATNVYTDNADALDVAATEGDATYQLQMPDSAARYVIRATNDKLPNVRLAQYLDENASYANLLFCEAAADDERANKLCEKTLNGQKVFTTGDNYAAYLMDSPCRQGTSYLETDQCGFKDTQHQNINKGEVCIAVTPNNTGNMAMSSCGFSTVTKGGICKGDAVRGCTNSIIENGGICESTGNLACYRSTINKGGACIAKTGSSRGCTRVIVNEGAVICEANATGMHDRTCGQNSEFDGGICVNGCAASTFKNGAICYAVTGGCNATSTTAVTYEDTSCCCGAKCPDTVPKCEASRCDPQYMS